MMLLGSAESSYWLYLVCTFSELSHSHAWACVHLLECVLSRVCVCVCVCFNRPCSLARVRSAFSKIFIPTINRYIKHSIYGAAAREKRYRMDLLHLTGVIRVWRSWKCNNRTAHVKAILTHAGVSIYSLMTQNPFTFLLSFLFFLNPYPIPSYITADHQACFTWHKASYSNPTLSRFTWTLTGYLLPASDHLTQTRAKETEAAMREKLLGVIRLFTAPFVFFFCFVIFFNGWCDTLRKWVRKCFVGMQGDYEIGGPEIVWLHSGATRSQ